MCSKVKVTAAAVAFVVAAFLKTRNAKKKRRQAFGQYKPTSNTPSSETTNGKRGGNVLNFFYGFKGSEGRFRKAYQIV